MRIVLVDDHPMVRNGLQQTIEIEKDLEVVGCASSCKEGVEILKATNPDLAIVDLKMPDGSGLDLVHHCKDIVPGCRYLILTAYGSPQDVSRAISEKVGGYILKEAFPEEILLAIRRVGSGRRYFDPEVMENAFQWIDDNPLRRLTARELEVLNQVSAGLCNSDIAEKLHISEKTVKKHISNILAKLEFSDRIQAALFGYSQGMGKDQEKIIF